MKKMKSLSISNRLKFLSLLLTFPFFAKANEGQKILGILNDFMVIIIFLVFFAIGLPILICISNKKARYIVFSIMNIGIIVFLTQEIGKNDLEIFNKDLILFLLFLFQCYYTWEVFKDNLNDVSSDDELPKEETN